MCVSQLGRAVRLDQSENQRDVTGKKTEVDQKIIDEESKSTLIKLTKLIGTTLKSRITMISLITTLIDVRWFMESEKGSSLMNSIFRTLPGWCSSVS